MLTLKKIADKYGLTKDGVDFALSQYQVVICEITHGRMSKLCYYSTDILSVAEDCRCEGCDYLEREEE